MVRDSGRRTPRGAVVWRSANGTKPGDDYVTPREAADALAALLGSEKARGVVSRGGRGVTLGAAADAWLERTETRHRLLTTPPSHITTAIGSPPTDPTGHAIWTTAAQEIDRYRQSVQLGPDIPGLGPRPERAADDRQCSNPACACTNSHASSTHGFPFANEHLTSRSSANQPCCYGHRASVHSCGGSNQPAPSRRHEPTPPRPRPRIDLHEPLLRASDAAALLGVPRSSVYEYARRHNDPLPSLAIGRHRRFCRSATESWPAGQTR